MNVNANKVNQKSFFKIMILIFGLVCFFNVLTSAEKPPLPSEFKVFKIAVIGSHIDGNKAMPHISRDGLNLNEFTVDKLCSCGLGEKLSDYDVANRDYNLKNEEIKLYENYPERLPKDSMLISRDGGWVVLSFYYLDNCNETETKMIIENCQYAICPFRAKSEEIEGDLNECKLKKRLTELRDFIRQYNKTCDIRFLYYIDNIKQADDVGRYQRTISEFSRDLYNDDPKLALQQEVQSHSLSKENGQCYRECFNSILVSLGRKVEEFEQLPNKKVLKINYLEVLEKIRFADELKESISNSVDISYDDFFLNYNFIRNYSPTNSKIMEDCYCAKIYPMAIGMLKEIIPANRLKEFYNKLRNVTVKKTIDDKGVLFKILLNIERKKKEKKSWLWPFSNDVPSFADEISLFNMYGEDRYKEINNFNTTYKKIFSNEFVRRSICDSLKKIMLESIDVKNKCQINLNIHSLDGDKHDVFRVERGSEDDTNEKVIGNFITILVVYIFNINKYGGA